MAVAFLFPAASSSCGSVCNHVSPVLARQQHAQLAHLLQSAPACLHALRCRRQRRCVGRPTFQFHMHSVACHLLPRDQGCHVAVLMCVLGYQNAPCTRMGARVASLLCWQQGTTRRARCCAAAWHCKCRHIVGPCWSCQGRPLGPVLQHCIPPGVLAHHS